MKYIVTIVLYSSFNAFQKIRGCLIKIRTILNYIFLSHEHLNLSSALEERQFANFVSIVVGFFFLTILKHTLPN